MVKSLIFNAAVSAAAVAPNFEAMGSIEARFEAYNVWLNKTYTDKTEMTKRFEAFAKNDDIIKESNSQNKSYTLGHNMFSDMSWDEFKAVYVGGLSENPALNRERNFDYSLQKRVAGNEADIDWVKKGGVTPVKDQGKCGSCWTFSTTGAMEGALFAATGDLVSLSEQELVSCDHTGQDNGCNGGLMDTAFDYISKNGICAEKDYPYTSGEGDSGSCINKCDSKASATGHKDVPANDEDALYTALQSSTVSVAIEADKSAFQMYKSGVLDDASCGEQLDHGVLLVGYGTDQGKEYWKVKNSWSASWGEEGYIRMVKGKNQCGIAASASQPKGVTGAAPTPPTPKPAPTPAPAPTPHASAHYGDPADGCLSDEKQIQVTGIPGDFCSPSCDGVSCPTDVPTGVTAKPQCALSDSSGAKSCALLCAPSVAVLKLDQKAADAMCGKATCKPIQGVGVCTYND